MRVCGWIIFRQNIFKVARLFNFLGPYNKHTEQQLPNKLLALFDVQIELEFISVAFVEGGNPENPDKNPRSKARTNNKLNPHETASTGIEPGSQRWDWGERS